MMVVERVRSLGKSALAHAARRLPWALVHRLGRMPPHSVGRRLGRLALTGRVAAVIDGPGRGLRMHGCEESWNYLMGNNEVPVQRAFVSYLHEDGVLYDVGANVGFFSLLGGRLVGPRGAVVGFEPVETNAKTIERNARFNGFGHVQVRRLAVSDRVGVESLWLAKHHGGHALASAGRPPDAVGEIAVHTTTLDALVDSHDRFELPLPTVVKIDVEGAEMSVLRGMRAVIHRAKPVVLCELDGPNAAAVDMNQRKVKAYLQTFGYRLSVLPQSYPGPGWCVRHLVGVPAA